MARHATEIVARPTSRGKTNGVNGLYRYELEQRNLYRQGIIFGMDTLQACLVASWRTSVVAQC